MFLSSSNFYIQYEERQPIDSLIMTIEIVYLDVSFAGFERRVIKSCARPRCVVWSANLEWLLESVRCAK